MSEALRCPNCGGSVDSAFCPTCGQEQRDLLTLGETLKGLAGALFESDGKLPRTIAGILRHPGRLTREYAEGKRGSQTAPTRLYLSMVAIYYVVAPYLGEGFFVHPETSDTLQAGALLWDSELLLLILIPTWALFLLILRHGAGGKFEEAFTFSVHYHLFFLVLMLVLRPSLTLLASAGLWVAAQIALAVGMLTPIAYLVAAVGTAFGWKGARRIGLAVLLFLIQVGIGQGLAPRL